MGGYCPSFGDERSAGPISNHLMDDTEGVHDIPSILNRHPYAVDPRMLRADPERRFGGSRHPRGLKHIFGGYRRIFAGVDVLIWTIMLNVDL